tara:strand:- start:351 stop:974 length:624 start_codon:yes stop_codon:yes gene_type:complete
MNKKYWDKYYSRKLGIQTPSSFASHVIPLINKGDSILELGCGNGRDSFYFANNGCQVYALDQSQVIINRIKKRNINPKFICDNIENFQKNFKYQINHCYARFFLHALDKNEENQVLRSISKILPENGLFFSENRSVKSDLYGKGEVISKDIFNTDHKRRFIRKNNLISKLKENGFKIETVVETNGVAIYKNDDPVVIRICARKYSNI